MTKQEGRIYEGMRRLIVGPFTIRMWIHLDEMTMRDQQLREAKLNDVARKSQDIAGQLISHGDAGLIATAIANGIPDVNAAEVLNQEGAGCLAYNDWP